MNIGILAQRQEKNFDGVNRVTIGIMKELLKIDISNKYSFIGNTDWLNIPIEHFDIIPDARKSMKLNYAVKFGKYNIIHSYFRPYEFSIKNKCAKILTIHDIGVLVGKQNGPYEFYNTYLRECAKNMDLIIADSEYTKKDIINYYNIKPEKIKVVYNGIYEKKDYKKGKISTKLHNIANQNYILAVSTMREYKNINGLVKAFCLFKDRHPNSDLKLVLTGKNDQSSLVGEQIQESILKQKDIIFTGYVSDDELSYLYENSIATGFVSFYEGFGLPVLESLSFGKTVICSDRTSLPEVGGDAVEYCNPYEIESIENAIEKVVLDDAHRGRLEEKAIIQASKFSYKKAAIETLEIYNLFR